MNFSSKIAGIALAIFILSLPLLAQFHSPPKIDPRDEALKEFYFQVFEAPSRMLKNQAEKEVRACLLAAEKCVDIYPKRVDPCLVSGARCPGEARPRLLTSIVEAH